LIRIASEGRPATVALFVFKFSISNFRSQTHGTQPYFKQTMSDDGHSSPTAELTESATIKHDPYAALRVRDFRLFLGGHVLSVLGVQMQTVAVGWQLYEKTRSAWPLAMVGLVQAAPVIGLALPAGQVADRFDRRKMLMGATVLAVISSLGLAL